MAEDPKLWHGISKPGLYLLASLLVALVPATGFMIWAQRQSARIERENPTETQPDPVTSTVVFLGMSAANLACVGVCCLFPFSLNILLTWLVWRDARATENETPGLWALLTFIVPVIGLAAYLTARKRKS